ncbi:MAG TPA: prolyl oligopeptidase family serine peptidase [Armatimonadota bacterium]|nr:prolyl oligopeptidase family serine peptidase [Armatimonadota bacterium]
MVDLGDAVAGRDYLISSGLADPGRIGIFGASFGGWLTLMSLAIYPAIWAGGVSLYGPFSVSWMMPSGHLHDPIWEANRSPSRMTDRITAPVLLIQAGHDTVATIDEARRFLNALREQGNVCDLKVFHDDTHGLPRRTGEACVLVGEFFARHLAPPPANDLPTLRDSGVYEPGG